MPSMIWWTQKFDFIQRHMDGWILTHSENMVKSCSSNCALHGWFTSQNLYIKTAIYEKKKMLFILNSIIPNTVVTKLWWWWWWCKFNHVSLSIKNTKKSEAQAQPQKGQHRHEHHVNSSINSKSVVPVALRSGSLEFPFWDWLSIERPAPPQWFSMSPSWDARIDSRKGEAKQ